MLGGYVWGNTYETYLWAGVLFIGLFLGFYVFRSFILKQLRLLVRRTSSKFDDRVFQAVADIPAHFYFLVSVYFPLRMLVHNVTAEKVIMGIFLVFVAYRVIRFVEAVGDYLLFRVTVGTDENDSAQANMTFYGLKLVIRIVLWITAILLVLSNLGFQVSSLVASLGISGIAVALAVQNVLSDIFSSFTIYFDKPFEVGDYIVIGEHDGTVERIGIKSTRIRTLKGDELVVSNKELTETRVRNFKKMDQRRVTIILNVAYETSNAKLKKVEGICKEAVDGVKGLDFLRCYFYEFGPHSLNYEFVYYVGSGEYDQYLAATEQMNLKIKEGFEKEGIEFAYPTQKVFVAK